MKSITLTLEKMAYRYFELRYNQQDRLISLTILSVQLKLDISFLIIFKELSNGVPYRLLDSAVRLIFEFSRMFLTMGISRKLLKSRIRIHKPRLERSINVGSSTCQISPLRILITSHHIIQWGFVSFFTSFLTLSRSFFKFIYARENRFSDNAYVSFLLSQIEKATDSKKLLRHELWKRNFSETKTNFQKRKNAMPYL